MKHVSQQIAAYSQLVLGFFKGAFGSAFIESTTGTISIKNMSPLSFEVLLKYMYTGQFNKSQFPKDKMEIVYQELFAEAGFYALNDTTRFKQLLFTVLSGENCIDDEIDENYSENAEQDRVDKQKKAEEAERKKIETVQKLKDAEKKLAELKSKKATRSAHKTPYRSHYRRKYY